MPVCAYCGKTVPRLTREHLWPASLHQRIDEANRALLGEKNVFYLDRIAKSISAEPTIKDVCSECNNGTLSELDEYICRLWDEYFHKIVDEGEVIFFHYDYDRLARWLLKMCFNSARVHNSDVKHLEKCRRYILGLEDPPSHFLVHLQLQVPSGYTAAELREARDRGSRSTRYEPRLNRVGHFGYMTRTGIGRLVRAVHLQSYLFLIHLFPERAGPAARAANLKDFRARMPYAKRLYGRRNLCRVKCKGLEARESLLSHYREKGLPPELSEVAR